MLIYRSQEEVVFVRDALRAITAEARRVDVHRASTTRDLLVEVGELEAGVADELSRDADGEDAVIDAWRSATVTAASLFVAVLGGRVAAARRRRDRLLGLLARLPANAPVQARVRPPEGFVHYGVLPEQYVAAATQAWAAMAPSRAVVIGLRSIGTSLSAVVAAVLADRGSDVVSLTLRPRGAPLAREPRWTSALAATLARHARERAFLLVDEGPGLSGSSLTGVAQALSALGVHDDRIAILPSWAPDGASFVSERARAVWPRHRKFVAGFDPSWIGLERPFQDVSAGGWRRLFGGDASLVHPWHERRKYLVANDGAPYLLKFAAVGRRGRTARRRAETLADAGWGPRVLDLRDGFLAMEIASGGPQDAGAIDAPWLEAIAQYLAFVRRSFPAEGGSTTPEGALREMVSINVREALGDDAARRVEKLPLPLEVAVHGDARMLPQEWLRGTAGFVKTDGVDHGSDHFYPGSTDTAWDLAGAIAELRLDGAAAAALVDHYARAARDDPRARLPAYTVAYLAYRSGYATMAAAALPASPERDRFARAARRYRHDLSRAIARLPGAA